MHNRFAHFRRDVGIDQIADQSNAGGSRDLPVPRFGIGISNRRPSPSKTSFQFLAAAGFRVLPFVAGDDYGSVHAAAGDDLRTFFDSVVYKFAETRFGVLQLPFGRGFRSHGQLTSRVIEIRVAELTPERLSKTAFENFGKAAARLPHSIRTGDLRLLGLTTQKCGYVEIVAGNFACDIANVLLNLVYDGLLFVGNC